MLHVAGRKVKIVTGAKTQTVNVYSAAGEHGEYDYRMQLRQPNVTSEDAIRENRCRTVADLVDFLVAEYAADVIDRPPATPSGTDAATPNDVSDQDTRRRPMITAGKIVAGIVALGSVAAAVREIFGLPGR